MNLTSVQSAHPSFLSFAGSVASFLSASAPQTALVCFCSIPVRLPQLSIRWSLYLPTGKLLRAENNAGRIVFRWRQADCATPLLHEFYWLPGKARLDYKIALMYYHCLQGLAQVYLSEPLTPCYPSRCLQSVPRVRQEIWQTLVLVHWNPLSRIFYYLCLRSLSTFLAEPSIKGTSRMAAVFKQQNGSGRVVTRVTTSETGGEGRLCAPIVLFSWINPISCRYPIKRPLTTYIPTYPPS